MSGGGHRGPRRLTGSERMRANREGRRGVGLLLRGAACAVTGAVVATVLTPRAGAAIAPAQVDTFTDDTPEGWAQGAVSPLQPTVITSGGPGGSADAYLQNVSSGNFGAGGKMVMINSSQWSGHYVAA